MQILNISSSPLLPCRIDSRIYLSRISYQNTGKTSACRAT
jgi:hypothetical protein